MRHCNSKNGFSLLEMLAVVTLLGIISAIIVPRLSGQAFEAKIKSCHGYKSDINAALERYWFATGTFASTLSQIENNNDYYPEVIPNCPVDNTAYTIDSTTHRIQGHSH